MASFCRPVLEPLRARLALCTHQTHSLGHPQWSRGVRRLAIDAVGAAGAQAGRFPGFWIEHAHPGQPPLVIDAVVEVSVQLELADDGGWEVNPAGVKIGKSDGRDAGPAQALCWASVSVIVQIDSTPAGSARYRLLDGARFLVVRVHDLKTGL
jgi:hypothetical protein